MKSPTWYVLIYANDEEGTLSSAFEDLAHITDRAGVFLFTI